MKASSFFSWSTLRWWKNGASVAVSETEPLPVTDAKLQTMINHIVSQANVVYTENQLPAPPMAANENYLSPDWVDLAQAGHFIFLMAGLAPFTDVEIFWLRRSFTDGATTSGSPNFTSATASFTEFDVGSAVLCDGVVTGTTILSITSPTEVVMSANATATATDLATELADVQVLVNGPIDSAGFTYNVYLDIVNLFSNGTMLKVHILNGPAEQIGQVGIYTVGKYPYMPLIGVDDDISLISSCFLVRNVDTGQGPDGQPRNIRADFARRKMVSQKGRVTQFGEQVFTNYSKQISKTFTSGLKGLNDASSMVEPTGAVSGTHDIDSVNGGLLITTDAIAGSVFAILSPESLDYESHDQAIAEDTATPLTGLIGDADWRSGFMQLDEFGEIINGIGHGAKVHPTTLEPMAYFWRRVNGVDVGGEDASGITWLNQANRDQALGGKFSQFFNSAGPVVHSPLKGVVKYTTFPWLGFGPQGWGMLTPYGEEISCHMDEYSNRETAPSLPDPDLQYGIWLKSDTGSATPLAGVCGSFNAGIFTSTISLSGIDGDGSTRKIGVNGFGAAQSTHISGISPGVEVGAHVTQFDPEIRNKPFTIGQTFRINASSSEPVVIPFPSSTIIGRVIGLSIKHAGTLGIGEEDPEETLFYNWSGDSVQNNGWPLLSGEPKDFHYGQADEGVPVQQINPLYFQSSGISQQTLTELDANTEDANVGVAPANAMYAADGTKAIFDALADTVTLSGVDASGLTGDITVLKIKALANKEVGAPSEIGDIGTDGALAEAATGDNAVSTGAIIADPDKYLVICFARRNVGADRLGANPFTNTMGYSGQPVTIDLGGQDGDLSNGGESRISVVYFPPQIGVVGGSVTLDLDAASGYEVASHVYVDKIDPSLLTPAMITTVANVSQGSFTDSVLGTANGVVVQFIASESVATTTMNGGVTELSEEGSSTNNRQIMSTAYKQVGASGATDWGAQFAGTGNVAAVAIAFPPQPAESPVIEVSHSEGGTSLVMSISDESPSTFEVSILGDADWSNALISNLELAIAVLSIGGAHAEIDRVWLEVGTGTGFVNVAVEWAGYPPVI